MDVETNKNYDRNSVRVTVSQKLKLSRNEKECPWGAKNDCNRKHDEVGLVICDVKWDFCTEKGRIACE